MNLSEMPNHKHCIKILEKVRWDDKPHCPYCHSPKCSKMESENRYHCATCNSSYSVTVGTIFHNTRLDLRKWFEAISLLLNPNIDISARELARRIHINKDTACRITVRINEGMYDRNERKTLTYIYNIMTNLKQ